MTSIKFRRVLAANVILTFLFCLLLFQIADVLRWEFWVENFVFWIIFFVMSCIISAFTILVSQ